MKRSLKKIAGFFWGGYGYIIVESLLRLHYSLSDGIYIRILL